MATYTKRKLSGSADGRGILVVSTASPGTLIHTAVAGTNDLDEIWLYAVNNTTASSTTTFQFGGVNNYDTISAYIPSKTGLELVVPGLLLQNGSEVRVFTNVSSGIIIQGFVNRITA